MKVTPRSLPAEVDWRVVSERVAKAVPRRFRAAKTAEIDGFRPRERREWLAYREQEPSLPPFNPAFLSFLAAQALLAIKPLGEQAVLYGVHKKGASLLAELSAITPAIGRRTIVFDDTPDSDLRGAVQGKRVLIIDDSIHTGDTCPKHIRRLRELGAREVRAFVAVASVEGLRKVTSLNVRVNFGIDPVPEKYFSLAFGLLVVPLLGLFRDGALSNRPHRSFKLNISTAGTDLPYRCLRRVALCDQFGILQELPPTDGVPGPVFRGAATLAVPLDRALRSKFRKYGRIDQSKFRVFLSKIDGEFHLCICAIVWPEGVAPDGRHGVEHECDELASWLLDEAERGLHRVFAGTGVHMARIESPIQ